MLLRLCPPIYQWQLSYEVTKSSKSCKTTLTNHSLAETIVPEDSITFSETFLPTCCEFVPVDVEDIVLNLPDPQHEVPNDV